MGGGARVVEELCLCLHSRKATWVAVGAFGDYIELTEVWTPHFACLGFPSLYQTAPSCSLLSTPLPSTCLLTLAKWSLCEKFIYYVAELSLSPLESRFKTLAFFERKYGLTGKLEAGLSRCFLKLWQQSTILRIYWTLNN